MKPIDLSGRTILFAGGAGYLGLPCCKLLAQLGANIVIADIDAARMAAAKEAIGAQGGAVMTV